MSRRRRSLAGLGATIAVLALPAMASADCTVGNPDPSFDGPHKDANGSFAASQQGSYVQIPFDVPAGTTGIRVRYCYDQPPTGGGNTLDMGVYEPLKGADTVYGPAERRGWSGSAVKDLAIAVNGFSPPDVYNANPPESRKAYVPGFTTRAYQPGAIPQGKWAVELGLASIVGPPNDPDGVEWRVRVETSTSTEWSDDPYSRAPYDASPAKAGFGWYSGDVHVHGEEEPGNSLMQTSFDFAFAPLTKGGAGLDFVGLVDHNNDINTGEIGRYQADYPGKLIIPGTEVTTYNGHYNNIGSNTFADFRGGPVYRWESPPTESPVKVADPVDPASQFGPIQSTGGWTQINHPTVLGGSVCRGCPWDYTDAETDYSKVDAVEVQNGAADFGAPPNTIPSPFTASAIAFYQRGLASGFHIAAVGSSDAHKTNEDGAVIGQATTVVGASDLSAPAIVQGIRDDRTYVKLYGNDGPDIQVTARSPGDTFKTLGDTLRGPDAHVDVQVLGAGSARPGNYTVRLLRDGAEVAAAPIAGGDFTHTFDSSGTGRYSVEVIRTAPGGDRIEVYSSPVWFQVGPAFHLGKVKRKKNGTAKLKVTDLRVPGEVKVSGKGLKTKRKSAGPGSTKVKIKAKGKAAKKLKRKGKAKVKAEVRFTPDGGERAQLNQRVKLKRKHGHG